MQPRIHKARAFLCACLVLFPALLPAADVPLRPSKLSSPQLFQLAANLRLHPRQRDLAARTLLERPTEARPILLKSLTSERSILRQTAAILLGRLGDTAAIPPLTELVESDDLLAREHAFNALAEIYRRHAPHDLQDVSPLQKAAYWHGTAARHAMPTKGFPDHITNAAIATLAHKNTRLRAAAAKALGRSASPDATTALLELAAREDKRAVLLEVAMSLSILKPNGDLTPLIDLARQDDPGVSLEAAHALYACGETRALEIMTRHLGADSASIRLRALDLLQALRDPSTLPSLIKVTRDPSWSVRLAAVKAIAALPQAPPIGVLQNLLSDPDPRVRAAAAGILVQSRTMGAEQALFDMLSDPNPGARAAACAVMGQLKRAEDVSQITPLLQDSDLEVATRAAETLAAIGEKAALPALSAALEDPRPVISDAARRAIHILLDDDPGDDPAKWPRFRQQYDL